MRSSPRSRSGTRDADSPGQFQAACSAPKPGASLTEITSELDNLTNDFPLHPAFVPFIEQTARYLAAANGRAGGGRLSGITQRQGTGARRGGDRPRGEAPAHTGRGLLGQSFQLTEAGYYQLRLANGRQNEAGVNPDPKESNLDVIPGDVLAIWQGNGGQSTEEGPAPGSVNAPTPQKIPESCGGTRWC